MIAFVGSVFSPYYAWALKRNPSTPPQDHCAVNVALYGPGCRRWTMTERGRRSVTRDARQFQIGPSRLHWDGAALVIDLDEIGMPMPRRVRGRVRVMPQALTNFVTPLDAAGRHRWGPIAPRARIEVNLAQPGLCWSGDAYLDCNEGDEPVERAFTGWDWARASLQGDASAVVYDVQPRTGPQRLLCTRFQRDGSHEPFAPPPRQQLAATPLWRMPRAMHSEGASAVQVSQGLEDTPFYSRSLLTAQLCGQAVHAVHESLSVPRLVSLPVRLMLPWRMPRRAT